MYDTGHQLKIAIFNVPYRHCRKYQERIVDYYADGRPLFEWERLRQNFILRNDQAIASICHGCPLNIYHVVEGCQGDLYGLNSFIQAVGRILPESKFLKLPFDKVTMEAEETLAILKELEVLEKKLKDLRWPVAQLFYDGVPAMTNSHDGTARFVFFEWEGAEDINFKKGNESYFIGISQQGIVLKDIQGNSIPDEFRRLVKVGPSVHGETLEGNSINLPAINGLAPQWDELNPYADSELVHTYLMASIIFKDVIDALLIFCRTAVNNKTGIIINSLL